MPATSRPIRIAFLLQVVIASLVVVLCILGLAAARERLGDPAATLGAVAIAVKKKKRIKNKKKEQRKK